MSDQNLVQIGFCSKPHGVKGGFVFHLENSGASVLSNGMEVSLFPKNQSSTISKEGESYKIKTITFGHKVMAYFEGVDDRNIVEGMIPFVIKIPRNQFPDISDDEIYLVDLIGCKAIDQKNKELIGTIEKYYDHGAQTNLVIQTATDEIDVPFLEQFVLEIDIDKKEVIVSLPVYMD